MRDTFFPSLVIDGAMNPMMIRGTQNVMSWPRIYLTVTTTFMTASLATRPTRMPITTDTSKMKGRLVKIFFISAAFLRLRLAIWSNTLP